MGKYTGIFLSSLIISIVLFLMLGAVGMTDYIDGLVITVGLILVMQLSVVIGLLVYLIDNLKGNRN